MPQRKDAVAVRKHLLLPYPKVTLLIDEAAFPFKAVLVYGEALLDYEDVVQNRSSILEKYNPRERRGLAPSNPVTEPAPKSGGHMQPDIASIQNPQVRVFYSLWWPQHKILYEFISYLAEEQLDYRMVDIPTRKADTPRESIAHILYVQLVYLNAVKTGKLEFKSMQTEHYGTMTKEQLLAEWERIDEAMFTYLTAELFDSQRQVEVPWGGKMNAVDLLFFLRDHDILHIGWNLAVMDHLNVPRYESLIQYWGP